MLDVKFVIYRTLARRRSLGAARSTAFARSLDVLGRASLAPRRSSASRVSWILFPMLESDSHETFNVRAWRATLALALEPQSTVTQAQT